MLLELRDGDGGALLTWRVRSASACSAPTPVEPCYSGARTLGVLLGGRSSVHRGGIRGLTGSVGPAELLGAVGLLTFGPAELETGDGFVSCRHTIVGGPLALRAGGSVTLAQRAVEGGHELSVTVEEYLPRLKGLLYAKGQSSFHAAVSRRYFELLTEGRTS